MVEIVNNKTRYKIGGFFECPVCNMVTIRYYVYRDNKIAFIEPCYVCGHTVPTKLIKELD